jgi:chromosomal replication initiation ATPase DnaA
LYGQFKQTLKNFGNELTRNRLMNQKETLQQLVTQVQELNKRVDSWEHKVFKKSVVPRPKTLSPENHIDEILVIKEAVCEVFGKKISVAHLDANSRPQYICDPRMIAMSLCTLLTTKSLDYIGEHFGGKDHGTVMNARDRIEELCENDLSLREKRRACEKLARSRLTQHEPEYYI